MGCLRFSVRGAFGFYATHAGIESFSASEHLKPAVVSKSQVLISAVRA
jgi:hypothetical protein